MMTASKFRIDQWILGIIVCAFLFRFFSLGSINLLVEEAYYWNYSAHLDWSYLDHPPMVALLIKLSTFFGGTEEWAVRAPSLICWVLAACYSYRLTTMFGEQGIVAVFFLSILPFFFLQSWVMTPDQPLLVAWSALLYYLYRACVLDESRAWWFSGIALGVGLLSKYTIVLLIPATFLFLLFSSKRYWLWRLEPYCALLLAGVIFSPVLYWNAMHDWVSFAFQSSRRLQETSTCSTHILLGLLVLFLTPIGLKHLLHFCRVSRDSEGESLFFLKCMFFLPLFVFTCFSMSHAVKFNWIGPSVLALIPWFARQFNSYRKAWLWSGFVLLFGYSAIFVMIITGQPTPIYQALFNRYINWEQWSETLFRKLVKIERDTQTKPYVVALDKYNIASEFAFYQQKLHPSHTYTLWGSDVFGGESLMYRYWRANHSPNGQTLVLVTDNSLHFNNPAIALHAIKISPIESWMAVSQGVGEEVRPYFYRTIVYD